MAHIADCMAIPGSPVMGKSAGQYLNTPTSQASFKAFSWRMASEQSQQKAPMYAKDKPLPPINDGRRFEPAPLPNQIFELPEQPERPSTAASITRPKTSQPQQQILTRRRKISVPELGPMTTVQESAMDSPTIPGHPAFHERSVSAPDDVSGRPTPTAKRSQTSTPYSETVDDLSKAIDDAFELVSVKDTPAEQAPSATPRRLAPLVIPKSSSPAPRLLPKRSTNHLRSGSTPPMDASRLARMEATPMNYGRFTPDLPYTRPNANDTSSSTLPTPVSAPVVDSQHASPRPWEAHNPPSTSSGNNGHRRNVSESSNIMDRGRPRKRGDTRSPPMTKPQDPKQPKSAERRAFEELPQGMKVSEAADKLNQNDMIALYKQALGQAERFEILKAEDVEALSKELRQLDERTDYLRRTYTSLRSGRRNLHSRICQYLRATRVARFSHESMLKQEEALAELDASIDDWFGKLEHAENRRTRVRQKLLEHVAAASILPVSLAPPNPLHTGVGDVVTPPRSPTKHSFTPRGGSSSPSPHRVVAQVPSTILEQPIIEEAAAQKELASGSPNSVISKRFDAASLRAYAGDDLFELLTDVEKEITRLSRHADDLLTPKPSASATQPRKQAKETPSKKDTPTKKDIPSKKEAYSASPEDSPAIHGAYEEDGEYFLTNAVFKP